MRGEGGRGMLWAKGWGEWRTSCEGGGSRLVNGNPSSNKHFFLKKYKIIFIFMNSEDPSISTHHKIELNNFRKCLL